MKTKNYKFQYNMPTYEYLMNSFLLNEEKKEKEILTLLLKGKSCMQIAEIIGYSERTVIRRKKEIYEKTKHLMY